MTYAYAPARARSSRVANDPISSGWPDVRDLNRPAVQVDNGAITLFDFASAGAIRAFQYRRAGQMIGHARANSEWWSGHLKGAPADRQMSWLDLPRMDRAAFRAAAEAGPVSPPINHGNVARGTTSGSSGIPMAFYVTGLSARLNRNHHNADLYRQGFDVNRAFASIEPSRRSGSAVGPIRLTTPSFPRDAKKFTIEEHARWLSKIAPAYLTTLPTLLRGVIEAYDAGIAIPPRIDKIVTYAETLDPELRLKAREVLGARVIDRYSTEETGPVAFQCPVHDDLHHVVVTNVLVEILDEQGDPTPEGRIGRVHVTSLNNWASPAVRYELGDLAAWRSSCRCGFQGMVLERMLGRTRFLIKLPNGERTYVGLPAKAWLAVAPIIEKRIVQTTPGTIRAEVVMARPVTDIERDGLRRMLKREIHPSLTFEIVQLDQIDWGPTYKRQDVVSLI